MAPAHAAPDFMSVDEIKAGMRGIAKTVVSGNMIEEFGIEVIGVMKKKGPVGDLILVRTFGDVIERTGGIAQGMSGSPVYIGGRLVGAIAYGWGLTDHKTGMVTPIADMLKLWEMPDTLRETKIVEQAEKEKSGDDARTKEPAETADDEKIDSADKTAVEPDETDDKDKTATEPGDTDDKDKTTVEPGETDDKDKTTIEPGETDDKDKTATEPGETDDKDKTAAEPGETDDKDKTATEPGETDDKDKTAAESNEGKEQEDIDIRILRDDNSDTTLIIPQTATLMASGFSEQAMALLRKELNPYGLKLETGAGSAGGAEIAYSTPEPGSMIGAELIRGDVSLATMGTVTYVQDGKILAFGHPFMKRGNVNYFLSEASVYTTLPGLENSFKIGFSGPAIGVVNQDRGAGIAGKLGTFPRIVPLRITVYDKTMEKTAQLAAQLAHDEEITPILSAATVYSAIEKASDRLGSGTAKIKFDIIAQDLPVDKFSRENMFYTNGNINELAISELFEAMTILTSNRYTPVNIIDVKVDIEVEKERRTASITGANAEKTTAKPGETVDVAVKLKPYREEPITRKVSFTVPKDQPAGSMMVSVRGGGVVSMNQILKSIATETAAQESLAKLIMSSKKKPKTFEEAIKNLTERDRYNDIVLEIMDMDITEENPPNKPQKQEKSSVKPALDSDGGGAQAKPDKMEEDDKKENQRKFNIGTDYIIDSETQFVVEIVK